MFHYISSDSLSIPEVGEIIKQRKQLKLSEDCINSILKSRAYLEKKINESDNLMYGINTGFGSLCDIKISNEELSQLQENLVLSHACGIGEQVPNEIVKIMLFLKIQSLSYGYSGICIETVERLIYFFNNDLLPLVYQQGSLGASGDLAPLAHLSLPLIGEGYFVDEAGKPYAVSDYYKEHNIAPLKLQAKEGLALLNGTQFMSAYGVYCLLEFKEWIKNSNYTAALSVDAWKCRIEPFLPYIHQIRPHNGQMYIAEALLEILEGSEIAAEPKQQVQDPYSFRCIPQVHGASLDTFNYVSLVVETEINSVTDNPNIFPDEDLILSGGNFHGQPLALVFDFLAIAIAELGNISERRCFQLLTGKRGLPEFLVAVPGLNSGFMIPQYTAASLVSQNKQLCTPASIDSITSSNGQEDHVSMGANGATKLYRVLENFKHIISIEWMNAAQAIEFRRPQKTSEVLEKMLKDYRTFVPYLAHDHLLHNDIINTRKFFESINH